MFDARARNPLAGIVVPGSTLLILAVTLVAGCKKQAPPAPTAPETRAATPAAKPADSYTVKGIVKAVSQEQREVTILHQAIPNFKTRDGEVVGMMSMVMPFGVVKGVDITSLTPGAKIEFTFQMVWTDKTPNQITKLTVLPPTEEIKFAE